MSFLVEPHDHRRSTTRGDLISLVRHPWINERFIWLVETHVLKRHISTRCPVRSHHRTSNQREFLRRQRIEWVVVVRWGWWDEGGGEEWDGEEEEQDSASGSHCCMWSPWDASTSLNRETLLLGEISNEGILGKDLFIEFKCTCRDLNGPVWYVDMTCIRRYDLSLLVLSGSRYKYM